MKKQQFFAKFLIISNSYILEVIFSTPLPVSSVFFPQYCDYIIFLIFSVIYCLYTHTHTCTHTFPLPLLPNFSHMVFSKVLVESFPSIYIIITM